MRNQADAGNRIRRKAAKGLLIFFLVMAALTFLSRITAALTVPRVVTENPGYGSLEHTVTLNGKLSAKQEIAVVTESGLLIQTVCAAAGERVEEGDVIAVLDMERLQEMRMQLEEEIGLAERQRQAAKEEKDTAKRRAKEDYDAAASRTGVAVESAKKALEEAKAAYAAYQGMLGTREVTEEEYRQSISLFEEQRAKQEEYRQALENQETALLNAKRALEDAERDGTNTEGNDSGRKAQLARYRALEEAGGKVLAPAAGIVAEMYGQVGQKTTDTAFCTLADVRGGLCFTALASKEEAEYLELGASVLLKKNKVEIEGIVKTMKTEEDGSVTVAVDVDGTDWNPGESAELCAVKQSEGNGMLVPLSAVHSDNGRDYVFVTQQYETVLGEKQKAVRVDVIVKEKNAVKALLEAEAISTSSEIITDCDRPIADGSQVRLWEK